MDDETLPAAGDDRVRADYAEGDAPNDVFEIEVDGATHAVPAALKGAFLRQADYTRKTQELAEQRRALDVERRTLSAHAEAGEAAQADLAQLAALDHQIAALQGVDWDAYAAQNPRGAQLLHTRLQGILQARQQLAVAVANHRQGRELEAARQAAEAMAQTGRTLAQEIDGWSPEVAGKLVEYAQAFGVTLEELGRAADPRLWKLLHKAWRADQAAGAEAAETPVVRPAVTVSGGGAGGAGVRDELGTKEWMRRRNEQVSRAR